MWPPSAAMSSTAVAVETEWWIRLLLLAVVAPSYDAVAAAALASVACVVAA